MTAAVHRQGGRIFAQLWHGGRLSPTSLQPDGHAPVAPSALIAAGVQVFIDPQNLGVASGRGLKVQHSAPRELTTAEVGMVVRDFALATENALAAGLDGIELHGANGYLINQLLDSGSNHRTDAYGGTFRNRR